MSISTQNIHPLSLSGDVANNFSNWLQQFKIFLIAANLDEAPSKLKVALFLALIGPQGLAVFNSFNKDSDAIQFEELVQLFKEHFLPTKNLTVERHKFFTRVQQPGESIDDFVTALKTLSNSCEFGSLTDSLVKDILICGLNDSHTNIEERLLQDLDLNLDKALQVCRSVVMSQQHVKALLCSTSDLTIGVVNRRFLRDGSNQFHQPANNSGYVHTPSTSGNVIQQAHSSTQPFRSGQVNQRPNMPPICDKCGQVYHFKCPALNKTCSRCGPLNHFAKMCRSKTVMSIEYHQSQPQENQVNTSDTSCSDSSGQLSQSQMHF
ncbi:uncharacterized protein LOC120354196 [Nilaparvata lugens]|uniref:uncharacterized protein LOC120354196 n=1 Tax=Nilaparvata lugens TaxID=108931 RepID=UPI00193D7637|nr:uncharacterized protein LOC120354196 [Nilaparvata lugens]